MKNRRKARSPGRIAFAWLQAVRLALDCKDREREMTAALIRDLCPLVLSRDQVALGFTRLLACAEVRSLQVFLVRVIPNKNLTLLEPQKIRGSELKPLWEEVVAAAVSESS